MDINISITVNELISALSLAMDLEGVRHRFHGWRTAILVYLISRQRSLDNERELFYAAMLHDIGAIANPNSTLHDFWGTRDKVKPQIRNHTQQSMRIIKKIPSLEITKLDILHHHERWNGTGYPFGLEALDITFNGQVISVCDFTDVILRDSYENDLDVVCKRIEKYKNSAFSPEIVDLACDSFQAMNRDLWRNLGKQEEIPDILSMAKDMVGPICVPSLTSSLDMVLEISAEVIDAKHEYTKGHSQRVAEYACLIGQAMGLNEKFLMELRWAGFLHDIGKVGIPFNVLDKSSKLTNKEYSHIKHHSTYTYEIISKISDLAHIAPIAAGHHERYDGKGYPNKLQGEEIPLGARILCVADTFDALTSGRAYQRKMSSEEVLDIFKRNSGSQFDPRVVVAALPVLRDIIQKQNNDLYVTVSA